MLKSSMFSRSVGTDWASHCINTSPDHLSYPQNSIYWLWNYKLESLEVVLYNSFALKIQSNVYLSICHI